MVHFGVPAGGNEFRISLDGKFLVAGNGQPYYPTFTPDGRHLFWFDTTFGEPKFTLFLDGNPIFKFDFDNLAVQRPGSWEMGEDGVLTIALRSTGCSSGFGSPRQADVMGWWDQAPGARLDQRCRRTNSRARSAGL